MFKNNALFTSQAHDWYRSSQVHWYDKPRPNVKKDMPTGKVSFEGGAFFVDDINVLPGGWSPGKVAFAGQLVSIYSVDYPSNSGTFKDFTQSTAHSVKFEFDANGDVKPETLEYSPRK